MASFTGTVMAAVATPATIKPFLAKSEPFCRMAWVLAKRSCASLFLSRASRRLFSSMVVRWILFLSALSSSVSCSTPLDSLSTLSPAFCKVWIWFCNSLRWVVSVLLSRRIPCSRFLILLS